MKKSLLITIFAAVSLLPVHAQQPDSVITEILSASVITEGNITYKVDRTTHFFSAAEVKAARDGRELVATIPNRSSTSRATRWRLWPARKSSS